MEAITTEQIREYVEPVYEGGIRHISDLFGDLVAEFKRDPREVMGFPVSSWPAFNEAFGGARPGEVVVLSAETGAGKTTFALNWILDFVRSGNPAVMFSQEIRWGQMIRNIAAYCSEKQFSKFEVTDVAGLQGVLSDVPLFYCEQQGMIREDFLLKAIDLACRVKGCRFVVIDHLDYIVRNRESWQSESYVVGDTMRRLCGKAHELNAFILLIVHPAKLYTQGTHRREISMDELKGSSSIKQEADAVLTLYQPKPDVNETILRFQKIRDPEHSKSIRGYLRFTFDPKTLHLTETSTGIEWGEPK